jgi:hypothetical protein
MKPSVKIFIGLSLFIFTIAFIVIWDTMIKDRLDTTSVVVVRPGVIIEKNEIITESKLIIEKRNRSTLIEGTVFAEEMSSIIGYEAKQQLFGNTIFSERYVDFESLDPDAKKGEAIRPIPSSWIYARPSTLRRKDYIDFYLFKPEGMMTTNPKQYYEGLSPEQRLVLDEVDKQLKLENEKYQDEREGIAEEKGIDVIKDDSNILKETAELLEEIELATEKADATIKGEKITGTDQENMRNRIMKSLNLSNEEWLQFVEYGEIPILVDIPIVYAKDGSGNEILNGENSSEEKRFTSTGAVSDLEVILNEDEYRLLKKYIELGYQVYISYN